MKGIKWLLAAVVLLICISMTPVFAKDNGESQKRRPGAVLYKVKADATDAQIAALAELMNLHNAKLLKTLEKLNLFVDVCENLPVSEEALCEAMKNTGAVDFAQPDYVLPPAMIPNDYYYSRQWWHTKINSPGAWDITTGNSSVIVAVCDTGVQADHPDLAANMMLPGLNTVDNTTNTSPILAHGTSVAGCVAAIGNNGMGVAGLGWRVKILPVRVSNAANGDAYGSDITEGITWAADQGAKVVNVSYSNMSSPATDAAAQYLRSKGGLLVVAAANDGLLQNYVDYASFISVGATDSSDNRTSWSNYGTFIDVVAPGDSIITLWTGSSYGDCYGTSFSSPIVAGLAALIYSVNPSFTPAQVENFIFGSCADLGAPGDDDVYGHGRIDAAAAVTAAKNFANNLAPVAVATATPTSGQVPLTVSFSGAGSSDPDGTVVSYQWNFGDGATASGVTASHTYTSVGTFSATLTVTDNKSATSKVTVVITVTPDPNKVLHVASIAMSAATSKQGTRATARVTIVDAAGVPKAGAIVSGNWTGIVSGTASGTTGADGSVALMSPKTRKSGTFTFTVTGVSASGYTYDAAKNVVTSGSITK